MSPRPREQELARRLGHRSLDLEPDRLAEAPPAELLLDREEEIVGLVLVELEVRVAGDPEEVVLEDLHAGEQEVEVRLDDLVEQHEPVVPWRLVRASTSSSRRGSTGGTLTRANRRSPVSGSRRPTAIESVSVEMYGNGWPGSTASGVRTG